MTTIVTIFFIGATILMIYEIVRVVLVNIAKAKGIKSDKEALKNAEECIDMWRQSHREVIAARDAYQKKMISAHSSITVIQYENDKLKAEIKDLNNELKWLSDSRDRYFKIVMHAEGDVNQQADRIKVLEAALARAEGLNRSFADGGIVSEKINPKDVRL